MQEENYRSYTPRRAGNDTNFDRLNSVNENNVYEEKKKGELDWAMFCCYPDKIDPQRMPSLFPIPSHIVRRRLTKTIDANKYNRLVWSPEYVFGQGALLGFNSVYANQQYSSTSSNLLQVNKIGAQGTVTGANAHTAGSKQTGEWNADFNKWPGNYGSAYVYDYSAPLTDDIANGGCRLIGAVIDIEYLGKIDDIQGIVEIGMTLNSMNTLNGAVVFNDIAFLSDDQMTQAPYYKKYRLSDGVRSIWFPMDESRFTFEEPMTVVDKTEFDIVFPSGVWDNDEVRASIIPTKLLASGLSGQGGETWIPGVTRQDKNSYRQENDNLRSRNRIEWAINFVGLAQPTPVRVHINYFYETCPHESSMDNFFPQKGPVGNTDIAVKAVQAIAPDVTAVTSSSSGISMIGSVFSKLTDMLSPYASTIGTAIGSMMGPGGALAGNGLGKALGRVAQFAGDYAKPSKALMPYKR